MGFRQVLRNPPERVTPLGKSAPRWAKVLNPAVVVLNLVVSYAALSPIWRQLDLASD